MLSVIFTRVWRDFLRQKKSKVGIFLFLFLFGLSLSAEFIANDHPLLVYYKGAFFFPIFQEYPEENFGGDLPIYTNFHDPYIQDHILKEGWILWPIVRYSYRTVNDFQAEEAPSPPTWRHFLGRDDSGQDVFAQILYSIRTSIIFALIVSFLSIMIGGIWGAAQGYFGGWVDLILARILEVWASVPSLMMIMLLGHLISPNFFVLVLLLTFFRWGRFVPLMRLEFLRSRRLKYVQNARIMGANTKQIIVNHILPNALIPCLSKIPFFMLNIITSLATLNFLGFGLKEETPNFGSLMAQARHNIYAPWIGLSVFLALALILVSLTLMGEGLREALQSIKKQKSG